MTSVGLGPIAVEPEIAGKTTAGAAQGVRPAAPKAPADPSTQSAGQAGAFAEAFDAAGDAGGGRSSAEMTAPATAQATEPTAAGQATGQATAAQTATAKETTGRTTTGQATPPARLRVGDGALARLEAAGDATDATPVESEGAAPALVDIDGPLGAQIVSDARDDADETVLNDDAEQNADSALARVQAARGDEGGDVIARATGADIAAQADADARLIETDASVEAPRATSDAGSDAGSDAPPPARGASTTPEAAAALTASDARPETPGQAAAAQQPTATTLSAAPAEAAQPRSAAPAEAGTPTQTIVARSARGGDVDPGDAPASRQTRTAVDGAVEGEETRPAAAAQDGDLAPRASGEASVEGEAKPASTAETKAPQTAETPPGARVDGVSAQANAQTSSAATTSNERPAPAAAAASTGTTTNAGSAAAADGAGASTQAVAQSAPQPDRATAATSTSTSTSTSPSAPVEPSSQSAPSDPRTQAAAPTAAAVAPGEGVAQAGPVDGDPASLGGLGVGSGRDLGGADIDPLAARGVGQTTASGASSSAGAAPGATAPAGGNVAAQIAAAVTGGSGGQRIELRLDPPDLGRVDIEFSFDQDGVKVVLRAEREEALDLMRRNADALTRELKDAGVDLEDMTFSGGDGRSERDEARRAFAADHETRRAAISVDVDAADLQSPRVGPQGGLDLRL